MRAERVRCVVLVVCFGILLAIAWPFLDNPLVFDDHYFFVSVNFHGLMDGGVNVAPRVWVLKTLALSYSWAGGSIEWLRLSNLFLHFCTAIVLYFFAIRLLEDFDNVDTDQSLSHGNAALLASLFFLFHPLAIFTQGYLVQRTILCATLFSLLSLFAFWHGLSRGRFALWASCVLFAVAIYAKEHAVMLPAGAFLLMVLHRRSGLVQGVKLKEAIAAIFLQGMIAFVVVLQVRGIIGQSYEPLTEEILADQDFLSRDGLFLSSVLNQACLFFKYLALWIIPDPLSISIDMRESFPVGISLSLLGGVLFFGGVGGVCLALLLRGGKKGLVGWLLLLPLVLFVTEFSAVRLQEPFVIYRSYLWFPTLFVVFALALRRLSYKLLFVLVSVLVVTYLGLSIDRLKTLSDSYLVWSEAAQLLERQGRDVGVFGQYRIYYNLGNSLSRAGRPDLALESYSRAIEYKPSYAFAYSQRGSIYLKMRKWDIARAEFDKAIKLKLDYIPAYFGRIEALDKLGEIEEAEKTRQIACALGAEKACGG
ncbi:tetratricopeptide repeat protein [Pseudomonas sp. BN411]|uniref:tetratricopeptide repeat protein n=1 Tax=Pseudomonas sp. BN411 TaxID=2567887 RepID=UPI002453CA0F|nr:tetratricopeptide repeat protein [Pseudomonas sp. BN411]MDH4561524.1 tetratricopeptide repeat protein [Pseudomonas sp. BN411]